MKTLQGKISWFGGKNDRTMAKNESLSLYPHVTRDWMDEPFYNQNYCAMRFRWGKMQQKFNLSLSQIKEKVRQAKVIVRFKNKSVVCVPVDWGTARHLNRLIDVSPLVMKELGCKTDDVVMVMIPGWIELS